MEDNGGVSVCGAGMYPTDQGVVHAMQGPSWFLARRRVRHDPSIRRRRVSSAEAVTATTERLGR